MFLAITILIFIAAIVLIFFVIVQNSKGGGLASGFSSSNQVMGVRKTTDFLEKATWTMAGVVVLLSIVSVAFLTTSDEAQAQQSAIKQEVQDAVKVDPNLNNPGFNNQAAQQASAQGASKEAAAPAPAKAAPAQSGTSQAAPAPQAPAAKK